MFKMYRPLQYITFDLHRQSLVTVLWKASTPSKRRTSLTELRYSSNHICLECRSSLRLLRTLRPQITIHTLSLADGMELLRRPPLRHTVSLLSRRLSGVLARRIYYTPFSRDIPLEYWGVVDPIFRKQVLRRLWKTKA